MAVTKRIRFEVLRRDNHTCRYCGATAADSPLVVDHVVPVALGGSDDPSNLAAACKDCNSGKTSVAPDQPLVEQVGNDALRWARALNTAAAERLALHEANVEIADEFRRIWDSWKTDNGTGVPLPLPPGWLDSVKSLLSAGLTLADLEELVEVAMASKARNTWKYFCGCCWTRVRKAQSRAAEIIAEQDRQASVGDVERRVAAVFAEASTDEPTPAEEDFEPSLEEQLAWCTWYNDHFVTGREPGEQRLLVDLYLQIKEARHHVEESGHAGLMNIYDAEQLAWFDRIERDREAREAAARKVVSSGA